MASPSYGIDVVALAFAVILAAALAFLLSHLVPQLVDLMMMPPPLRGRAVAGETIIAPAGRAESRRGILRRGVTCPIRLSGI